MVRHTSRFGLPSGADYAQWLMADGRSPVLDEARGLRRARAATLFMLALPGSTYLYQGEELGLPEVADLPITALADPIWLRTGHTEKGRDGCRVPLPWRADGDSYGFGSGAGWLPQPAGFAPLAVSAQLDDPARRCRSTGARCGCAGSCGPTRRWSGCRPTRRRCCTSSGPAAGTA